MGETRRAGGLGLARTHVGQPWRGLGAARFRAGVSTHPLPSRGAAGAGRNEGRSRGFRSIILFRRGDRAVFVYGFAKSDRRNLRPDELEVYRSFADEVLGYEAADLAKAVGPNKWKELENHGKDAPERGPGGDP